MVTQNIQTIIKVTTGLASVAIVSRMAARWTISNGETLRCSCGRLPGFGPVPAQAESSDGFSKTPRAFPDASASPQGRSSTLRPVRTALGPARTRPPRTTIRRYFPSRRPRKSPGAAGRNSGGFDPPQIRYPGRNAPCRTGMLLSSDAPSNLPGRADLFRRRMVFRSRRPTRARQLS